MIDDPLPRSHAPSPLLSLSFCMAVKLSAFPLAVLQPQEMICAFPVENRPIDSDCMRSLRELLLCHSSAL